MTTLERLREDLAKICDAVATLYSGAEAMSAKHCADSIRAHDLAQYESAPFRGDGCPNDMPHHDVTACPILHPDQSNEGP